jgi:NAD(P)-dependent dehydrogenase (short-subunit alcohol dehydrogenase family)
MAEAGGVSRNVLVLGGSTEDSIGAGICNELVRRGHYVYAPSPDILDVLDPKGQSWGRVFERAMASDIVYCVGINELSWLKDLQHDSFERIMNVNVWGFVNLIQQLRNHWRGPHNVLALTSDAAVRPMRTSLAYCASKAALSMAIKVAARELTPVGWRINGLAPGKVDGTAMTRYVDGIVPVLRGWTEEEAEEYERKSSALGRPLTIGEVSNVACDVLLSEAPGWTGDIITVNGGR